MGTSIKKPYPRELDNELIFNISRCPLTSNELNLLRAFQSNLEDSGYRLERILVLEEELLIVESLRPETHTLYRDVYERNYGSLYFRDRIQLSTV